MAVVQTPEGKSAGRIRAAYLVQQRYGVPSGKIAAILGFRETGYRNRLRQLDLKILPIVSSAGMQRDAAGIMNKIQQELARLANDSGLPDKSAADALTALAKTVKTVVELMRETEPEASDADSATVALQDIRMALKNIDGRIDQLADLRVVEILRRRPEPVSETGIEPGMAVSGA